MQWHRQLWSRLSHNPSIKWTGSNGRKCRALNELWLCKLAHDLFRPRTSPKLSLKSALTSPATCSRKCSRGGTCPARGMHGRRASAFPCLRSALPPPRIDLDGRVAVLVPLQLASLPRSHPRSLHRADAARSSARPPWPSQGELLAPLLRASSGRTTCATASTSPRRTYLALRTARSPPVAALPSAAVSLSRRCVWPSRAGPPRAVPWVPASLHRRRADAPPLRRAAGRRPSPPQPDAGFPSGPPLFSRSSQGWRKGADPLPLLLNDRWARVSAGPTRQKNQGVMCAQIWGWFRVYLALLRRFDSVLRWI